MSVVYLRAGFQAVTFLFINMIVVAIIYSALPRIVLKFSSSHELGMQSAE